VKDQFSKVVGQQTVKKLLAEALRSRQFSHAYLFEGPVGLGKEIMAREFAAAILCESDHPPCHECNSCRQVAAGTHQELRWIVPENPEKDTSLSVETIRSMIKDVYLKPYTGDWKIYVFPQADIMTPQAQNALLKTLEEPPDHAVMILASAQPEKLLPTVLSRCQRATFRPVSSHDIRNWLLNRYELSEVQASQVAAFANGTPSRAVRLMESDAFRQLRNEFLELTDLLVDGQLSPLLDAGLALMRAKNQALDVIGLWQEWFRDLHVLKLEGEADLLINQDQIDRLLRQASAFRRKTVSQSIDLLEECREDLVNHGNQAYVTEMLLINLLHLRQ
jgi:DNA polymerase III subunit delta'